MSWLLEKLNNFGMIQSRYFKTIATYHNSHVVKTRHLPSQKILQYFCFIILCGINYLTVHNREQQCNIQTY